MHPLSLAIRVGVAGAALIVSIGVMVGAVDMPGVDALAALLARASAYVLGMLGVPASPDGAVIDVNGFVGVIVAQCTAVDVLIVFSAAVLVWPVSIGARMWGLLLGAVALSALNFARIVSLLLMGAAFPEYFDTAHMVVWQPAMLLAASALWLLWLRWASNDRRAIDSGATG